MHGHAGQWRYLRWKASVWSGVGPKMPTAQASVEETAASWLSNRGLGLAIWLQLVPSQCRIQRSAPVRRHEPKQPWRPHFAAETVTWPG